jgi:hypothetical protein
MAQIYKEQVQAEVPVTAPEFEGMDIAEQKRQEGVAQVDQVSKQLETQYQQSTEAYMNENENLSKDIVKNAYELYPDNPAKFTETVNKGMKNVYQEMPSEAEAVQVGTQMQLFKTSYDARILSNNKKKARKQRNASLKASFKTDMDYLKDSVYLTYNDPDGFESPELNNARTEYNMRLENLNRKKDVRDENGNYVLSDAQRAQITEFYDNKDYYALSQSMARNYNDNPAHYESQMEFIRNNPDEASVEFGLSEDARDKALGDMEAVVRNDKTPERLAEDLDTRERINTQYGMLEVEDGEITKGKYAHTKDLAPMLLDMDDNEAAYNTSTKLKEELIEKKRVVAKAIYEDTRKDLRSIGSKDKGKAYVVNSLDSIYGVQEGQEPPFDTKMELAELYARVEVAADKQGIDLDSNTNEDRKRAAQLANLVADNQALDYANAMGMGLTMDDVANNPVRRNEIVASYRAAKNVKKTLDAPKYRGEEYKSVRGVVLAGLGGY